MKNAKLMLYAGAIVVIYLIYAPIAIIGIVGLVIYLMFKGHKKTKDK